MAAAGQLGVASEHTGRWNLCSLTTHAIEVACATEFKFAGPRLRSLGGTHLFATKVWNSEVTSSEKANECGLGSR